MEVRHRQPGFKPAPLAEVLKDLQDEQARAEERLPKLARQGPRGQQPIMHPAVVNRRLHSYATTVQLLERLRQMEVAGTLPPELQL